MEQRADLLCRSLSDFLRIDVDETALARFQWRDFGNGVKMSRLERAGKRELVLYWIAADARRDAFLKHEHLGGEFYLVLKGKIADETGQYGEGEVVFLDSGSVHTPFAIGETIVLVLWPAGVQLVES